MHLQKARVLAFFPSADVPTEIDKKVFLKLVPFGQPAIFLSLHLSTQDKRRSTVCFLLDLLCFFTIGSGDGTIFLVFLSFCLFSAPKCSTYTACTTAGKVLVADAASRTCGSIACSEAECCTAGEPARGMDLFSMAEFVVYRLSFRFAFVTVHKNTSNLLTSETSIHIDYVFFL